MQLPTSADLVRAFIADLSNVLDVGSIGERPTIQRTLWCASSTATLTADRDYVIVGIVPLTVGAWVLSTTPTTVAQIGLSNGVSFDVVAAVQSPTMVVAFPSIRWGWASGTKLYLVSTAGIGITFILEP